MEVWRSMPRGKATCNQEVIAREVASIKSHLSPGFKIMRPDQQTAPFVFCSPHSGRVYTDVFVQASRLSPLALRKSEDCYVDQLFESVCDLGAPLISALFPRAYVDVNREAYELDPQLFRVPLPHYANSKSVRVAGGLGTIARIVSEGEEIYPDRLLLGVAEARIKALYVPFHEQLAQLLDQTRRLFGQAILIDCHSMPAATVGRQPGPRPDFVLGDRFGETCDARLTLYVQTALSDMGYRVQLNRPYAGGYITEYYGSPASGTHALQIEINRALYMNERTLKPNAGFDILQKDLATMVGKLFENLPPLLMPRAQAAE